MIVFLLEKSLSELNIPLTILQSDGFKEDPKLIQDLSLKRNIDTVYWNRIGGSTLAHTNTANSSICLPLNDAIIPSSGTYLKLCGQKYFEIAL